MDSKEGRDAQEPLERALEDSPRGIWLPRTVLVRNLWSGISIPKYVETRNCIGARPLRKQRALPMMMRVYRNFTCCPSLFSIFFLSLIVTTLTFNSL